MTVNLTSSMKIFRSFTGSEPCLGLGLQSRISCLRTCFGLAVGPSGHASPHLQSGLSLPWPGLLSHSASQPEQLMPGLLPRLFLHQESHSFPVPMEKWFSVPRGSLGYHLFPFHPLLPPLQSCVCDRLDIGLEHFGSQQTCPWENIRGSQ